MAKKVNWADMDQRIRVRKVTWSQEEAKALEAGLKKLPDLSDNVEVVDVAQPALSGLDTEDGEEPAEDGAAEPSDRAGAQSG